MDYKGIIELSDAKPDNTIRIDTEILKKLGHYKPESTITLHVTELAGDFFNNHSIFLPYKTIIYGITLNCTINSSDNGDCCIYYTTLVGINVKLLSFKVQKGTHNYPMIMIINHNLKFSINVNIISIKITLVKFHQDKLLSSERYNKYLINADLFDLRDTKNIIIRIKPNDFAPEMIYNNHRDYFCDDVGTELVKRNEIIKRIACVALKLSTVMNELVVSDVWYTIYNFFYGLV